ncbi:hypothetical protein BKA70DRAFT_1446264 [Coprinopsis sp. MPI-PUGE-AT-0042]|nr:hypothetical protein BKA70DRAFT_1446264 [Coprinopsis sp. MPI-PUGE-AT-0042]
MSIHPPILLHPSNTRVSYLIDTFYADASNDMSNGDRRLRGDKIRVTRDEKTNSVVAVGEEDSAGRFEHLWRVSDGLGFEDAEKVEWAMNAVLRGVKEPRWSCPSSFALTQNEENAPLLSATSPIRTTVESTRLELLRWIGKRWIGIRQEGGFDVLEGWALKEISDHIEVPLEDLFNPNPNPPPRLAQTHPT